MTPKFLIVGAMKGGTTTLYYDLSAHPDLHLPARKEPDILVMDESDENVLAAYAHHFRNAGPEQICGEASTSYTKRPTHDGVPERALRLLGPDLRIIYITRDPVARALSQYRHERQHGLVSPGFEAAIRNEPRFIEYGRYEWQIAPWRERFGDANVMQIDLAEYSSERERNLDAILSFIGVDPSRRTVIDTESKANTAQEQKAIHNPFLRGAVYSGFYQHYIKPMIPRAAREKIRRSLLREPEIEQVEISPELHNYILSQSRVEFASVEA